MSKTEKVKQTVEGRPGPRALTEEEKRSAQLFVPGHSVREPLYDTSRKELMSVTGENTELLTKTRMRAKEIPANATEAALIRRINIMQQFCARCGRPGVPTRPPRDDEFTCTHEVTRYKDVLIEGEKTITIKGRFFWSKDRQEEEPAVWGLKKVKAKETITWQPHYWDTLSMGIDKIWTGRVSLDGMERKEFIEDNQGKAVKEDIHREVTPASQQQQQVS
jgi:hypothetical protein